MKSAVCWDHPSISGCVSSIFCSLLYGFCRLFFFDRFNSIGSIPLFVVEIWLKVEIGIFAGEFSYFSSSMSNFWWPATSHPSHPWHPPHPYFDGYHPFMVNFGDGGSYCFSNNITSHPNNPNNQYIYIYIVNIFV